MSMVSERKEEMKIFHADDIIISDRAYNTVLGCTIGWGVLLNVILCVFCGDFVASVNPIIFLIAYFACAFGGMAIAYKSDNPIVSFIGYNMVVVPVGLVISSIVSAYGGIGSEVVAYAFLYTMIITGCMIALSVIYPAFFSRIGGLLFSALIGMILCEVFSLLMGFDTYWAAWVGAVIFSLYIGYDFWVSQQYVKTIDNAIDSSVAIYLDIANLFLKLLRILGRRK